MPILMMNLGLLIFADKFMHYHDHGKLGTIKLKLYAHIHAINLLLLHGLVLL